ncbi:hypothetical protein PFLUV_G00262980 [Perca fluviatilis]|uniref:Uncharacterized protein n=1 Tax=Perca fluviatilis TaxID=8168 RepID=A0A6A5E034_PERFL|nr:hypothetical protein PFLUV_G00262980 [Perca fluviatilis]
MGNIKDHYDDFIFGPSSLVASASVGSVRVLSDSTGVSEGRTSAAALSAREKRHSSARTADTPGRTEDSSLATDRAPHSTRLIT